MRVDPFLYTFQIFIIHLVIYVRFDSEFILGIYFISYRRIMGLEFIIIIYLFCWPPMNLIKIHTRNLFHFILTNHGIAFYFILKYLFSDSLMIWIKINPRNLLHFILMAKRAKQSNFDWFKKFNYLFWNLLIFGFSWNWLRLESFIKKSLYNSHI